MPEAGWVRIYHPDQVDHTPDPDEPDDALYVGLVTQEAYDGVWQRRGFVNLDAEAEATAETVEAATSPEDETAPDDTTPEE